MKFSPEVCLRPRKNLVDLSDDPDHDPYPGPDPDRTDLHDTFTRGVSHAKDQSITCWG